MSAPTSTTITFTLAFTMLSDWGVGTGTGRSGDVDALVAKDALGLPMLPAKSVTGILRDACEEVAFALDGRSKDGPWNTYLGHLLGDQPAQAQGSGGESFEAPRPAALSIRPGRLSAAIRRAVADETSSTPAASPRAASALASAATIVRPHIAIDQETGTTAKGSLRMIERGRAGQEMLADATLDLILLPSGDGAPPMPEGIATRDDLAALAECAPAAALMLTLARGVITHIGSDRRRGAGRCELGFRAATQPESSNRSTSRAQGPTVHRISPRVHRFGIECLTPVVASAGVTGNVVHTLDYLPGYLLLPVVAAALGPHAGELIAQDRLLVSDATPGAWTKTAGGSTRMMPAPASWQVAKGSDDGLLTSALQTTNVRHQSSDSRPVGVRGGWVHPDDPPTSAGGIVKLRLSERAHAVIDDAEQRPTEATGGLYVQEAIAAGSRFVFEVRAPLDSVPLPHVARLGRSKKDDYGSVRLTSLGHVDEPAAPAPPRPGAGHLVRVLLTSDCLVLDPATLAPTTNPDVLTVQVATSLGLSADCARRAYTTVRRHESWSATWGLPRPSLVAIRAGSVIEFEGDIDDPAGFVERTSALQAEGIGIRRAEGFGRLLVNPGILEPAPTPTTSGAAANADIADTWSPPGRPTHADAHPEVLTLWQSAVLTWAAEASLDAALPLDGARATLGLRGWTNSQLGLLREAVTRSPAAAEVDVTGQERLRGRVASSAKLADLLNEPERTWALLGTVPPPDPDRTLSLAARQLLLLHCIQQQLRASTQPATTQEGQD